MNASRSIIVWESEVQPHIWVPYTPRVSQHIQRQFRRSMDSGKVDLHGQNSIELTGCQIDFTHMRQINVLTNESIKVRSKQYPSDCPFAKGVYWKWFSGYQWQVYDVPTSNFIEDAFQQNSKRVDLRYSPIRIPNIIKFDTMEQVNRKTKFSRKIEREETKEQYPHETTNMPGQSGLLPLGFKPTLPSSTVIRHSTLNNTPVSTTSITQPGYPPIPNGSGGNGTYTKSNLTNHTLFSSNRHLLNPSNTMTTQSVTHSLNTQPSTQAHNPIMPSAFTSTAPTHSNLGNHKPTPNHHLPSPTGMVTTQSVTHSLNTLPLTHHPTPIPGIIPGGSSTRNVGSFNPFSPLRHSSSFTPPNVNISTQLGSNSMLNPTSNTRPNAMINLNNTGLNMPNKSDRPPVGHTPFSSQNATSGASFTPPTSHQANTNTPQASRVRTRRRQRADALGPTPKSKRSISGPLGEFAKRVRESKKVEDECAICLESLNTPSDYDLNPNADVQCVSADILQLRVCKHIFHRICLQRLYESGTSQNGCLRCPTCKTIHGIMKGNQPEGGTMNVSTCTNDIPGYPGCGSIVIVYNFTSGTQGPNHPSPGQPYYPNAFPRTCYLPNNSKGQKVLKLLKTAFDRQLVFTVGRSVTTGQDNCIVWNDIHHKTEGYGNGSGYGYPDPNYLDNVLAELASHGVTEDS